MIRTVLVIVGGAKPSLAVQSALPHHDFCVAADSGADHAIEMGLVPNVIVGDLDSISSELLTQVRSGQYPDTELEQHPTTKDETDLELAFRRALATRPDRVTFLGVDGGRPDHFLGNLLAISSPRLADLVGEDQTVPEIEALFGTTRVSVVHRHKVLTGKVGDLLSLLPIHGSAIDVTLTGAEYPLINETLSLGSARGLSNILVEPSAELAIGAGTLLVLQPEAFSIQAGGSETASRSVADGRIIGSSGERT